jgi:cytidylate kinase
MNLLMIKNIITVDGPSGVGKGTMSRMLAQKLGWHYLDSGALYRLTALSAMNHNLDTTDEAAMANVAVELNVRFDPHSTDIFLNDGEVSAQVREEQTGVMASKISAFPGVREALMQRQYGFAKAPGLVTDGRDMGTVVFPEALCKFFLTASAEVRRDRRTAQLDKMGQPYDAEKVLAEIKARDARDENRTVSPLKPADDGVVIDTSSISINEVFEQMWNTYES